MTLCMLAIAALLTPAPSSSSVQAAPAANRPAPAQAPVAKTPATGAQGAVERGGRTTPDLAALQLQVMLDRAGFSPGVIDGRMGPNTERALALYQAHRGEEGGANVPPLAPYAITPADEAGPFTEHIPSDLVEQAALPALSYGSLLEALAERFHATPELLQGLNPSVPFAAGHVIQVPNVEPLSAPAETVHIGADGRIVDPASRKPTDASGRKPAGAATAGGEVSDSVMQRPDVLVTVGGRESRLTVTDAAGQVVFSAPVTTGSEQDPLPIGEWKITGVLFNPVFHYNPDLFWDADPGHTKAQIQPGPNNPVGLVWIDLDKEHYGLHGTPEPAAIGRAQSHGCVRLTNWDVVSLAGLVKPGTKVVFTN